MEALQRLHNRGSISTGYDIDNSVKLETANNEWLIRNSPTAGNRKTHTFSFWIKRTALGTINASGSQGIIGQGQHGRMFFGSDYFQYRFDDGHDVRDITTLFRDTSAWYHIVVAVDTNQSTSSNRVKIYYNGVQTTTLDHDGGSYPDIQDSASGWFNTNNIAIGTLPFGASYTAGDGDYDMSGYLADFAAVDGTQYAPTDFGEFDDDSGIWKPKDLSDITFGSEGFYLKFDDASALGADSSGNSNNFTLNNIAAADQATDTPTNNFCTLNPLNAINNGGGNNEYTEGATKGKALQESEIASGTMAVAQGKWYYECKGVLNSEIMAGWGVPNKWGNHSSNPGYDNYSFAVHNIGRVYYAGNAYIDISPSVSFDTTDIISVAVDIDNGFAYWAKNGTWMGGGSPTSGSTGTGGFDFQSASAPGNLAIEDGDFLIPAVRTNYHTNSAILLNFGGYTTISISSGASDANGYGTFEYAPPSGYYALCTKNLEEFG